VAHHFWPIATANARAARRARAPRATALCPRGLAGKRDGRSDQRAALGWAVNPELAVEDGKPVRQPEETAAVGPGASDAVVAHLDPEGAVLNARHHRGTLRTRVLCDVGQRLGDDEIRGRLDRSWQADPGHVVLDRHRHPRGQRVHSRAQPTPDEDRWEDAVREFAQLDVRTLRVVERFGQQGGEVLSLVLEGAACQLQRDDRVDQPLLRTVVQIADHAPALIVCHRHDSRPRRCHLRPGFGVRDRRRDELGEGGDPRLRVRRERLVVLG
jgi:hypothetical protein